MLLSLAKWGAVRKQGLRKVPRSTLFRTERLEHRHLLAGLPVITEFVADNKHGINDEDGESSDWIEVYNAGDEPVNLEGWHLTDSIDDQTQWAFPGVTLDPASYLVVFASGKDRRVVGNPLHTNFQLDANGEYVALVMPDGATIASEYTGVDGVAPKQRQDISYGRMSETITSTLLPVGTPTRVLVPTAGNGGDQLGETWKGGNEPFDDGLWMSRETGFGFDNGVSAVNGFALLDDFESLLPGDLGTGNGWSSTSANVDVVVDPVGGDNQVLQLTTVNQGASKPISIPNTSDAATVFFRMRRAGQTNFSAGASDVATLGTAFTDYEVQLNIQDGTGSATPVNQLNARDGGAFRALDTWAENTWYNVWLVVNNVSNSYRVYMQGGSLTNQTLLDAGTQTVFAFRNGPATNPLVNFLLRTSTNHLGSTYIDDVYVDSSGANLAVPIDVDYSSLIAPSGDLTAVMPNVNASVFSRTMFEATDVSRFNSLQLRMRYDDGFVAYLNGIEVARKNAPLPAGSPVAWNGEAIASHDGYAAIIAEDIDITQSLSALRHGTNVLAIHGLNRNAADGDFLLVPELLATELSATMVERYFQSPTPGAANNEASSLQGLVADTRFSGDPAVFRDRGFYDSPFQVTISTPTPGATLVYTTNGSAPTLQNGTVVVASAVDLPPSANITITGTTTLRTAAFKNGFAPTDIDTQTYLFASQVVTQSGAGLPTSWGAAPGVDYGMDPEIYNDPLYRDQIVSSLKSLPTVSVTLDVADMWGPNGIYSNTMSQGTAWERAASVELLYPDGKDGFQINAGIQVQGGASREVLKSPKHSFRLLFKDEWGPDKLEFPIFGDDATDTFDALLLRAGFNNSWIHWDPTQRSRADYVRDSWANATQREMGQLFKHDTFVHLYINGLYWGMYDLAERPEESFATTYLDGDKDDYDVINNQVSVISGTVTAWNEMMAIANAGVTTNDAYARIKRYLDIENFIDYMILNYYGGNLDWDDHNWYAVRRTRVDGQTVTNAMGESDFGFKFIDFDGERMLELATDNRTSVNNANRPTRLHNQLIGNAEYRLKFADRVQRHLFNNGALTPAVAAARHDKLTSKIESGVIAESVRWGDYRRDVHPYQTAPYLLYTPAFWQAERTRLRNSYFPTRTTNVINQFIGRGWFPNVPSPTLAVDGVTQSGGEVAPGAAITLGGTGGTIYYTLDGTDPRHPSTVVETVVMDEFTAARAFVPASAADLMDAAGNAWYEPDFTVHSAWKSGRTGVGYERTPADYAHLLNLTVPEMDAGNNSVLIRVPFAISSEIDLASINALTLNMKYDDGFVAYINGVRVAAVNQPEALDWNARATRGHVDASALAFESFAIDLAALRAAGGALVTGENLLAIHGLNDGITGTSSDLLLLPQLVLGRPQTTPGLSNGARIFDGTPITINATTRIMTRRVNGSPLTGAWSALTDATFIVSPAVPGTIAITEVHYNPSPPTAAELAVDDSLTGSDFEFVEIQNISPRAVSLLDVHFTNGIEYRFGRLMLDAGAHGVLVRNPAAFALRYGNDVNVAGQFTAGGLSNAGEQITLNARDGAILFDMQYADNSLWPVSADGVGASLENVSPESAGDGHDVNFTRWRGSTAFGGSPGRAGIEPRRIIVNEVRSRTRGTGASGDAIELWNISNVAVDISGWYLSDAATALKKYRIPDGTVLAAGAYRVFDETDFNPTPSQPGPNDFGLNGAEGDSLFLAVANSVGEVIEFVDAIQFPAARENESFVRYGDGTTRMVPAHRVTLGCLNDAVRVGPLVVSEIHYAPDSPSPAALAVAANLTADDLEFVEVLNPTLQSVSLEGWRLRGGIDYDFPAEAVIAPGASVVVLSFNPSTPDNAARRAGFMAQFGMASGDQLMGGYQGRLSAAGDRVILQRPDQPPVDQPNLVPHLIEDEVAYDELSPWGEEANGMGQSLHRISPLGDGNRAQSWSVAAPSPGSVLLVNSRGDFDGNGTITSADIDAMFGALRIGSQLALMDLNEDGSVDQQDIRQLLLEQWRSEWGDINLDGAVDGQDFEVWNTNRYRDCGVGWTDGDLNGDQHVDGSDFNQWLAHRFSGGVIARSATTRLPRAAGARRAPGSMVGTEDVSIVSVAVSHELPRNLARRRDVISRRLGETERNPPESAHQTKSDLERRIDNLTTVDRVFAVYS